MKVVEKVNTTAQNGNAKPQDSKMQEKPVNGLPVSKAFAGEKKPEAQKPEEAKEEKNANLKSLARQGREEAKAKQGLNLESTLKLVEELHRKKVQRDKLLQTIADLEGFEIQQEEEAEATGNNGRFQRCQLIVTDDKGNDFATKNPVIIQAVASYVNRLCSERLGEIEANILLPE